MSTTDDQVTSILTTEISNLIQAKEALDEMAAERRELLTRSKLAKERILEVMSSSGIDKANFENYAVSVAKSNRTQPISSKNLHEILAKAIPETDATELASQVVEKLDVISKPFIRLSKKNG